MKPILYVVLVTAIIVAVIGFLAVEKTTILTRKALQEFEVVDHSTGQPATVSIDGRLIGGILAISDVRQYRSGKFVVVVVRAGLTRPGRRNARFHYDVSITSDVDEVSFGAPSDVIWQRRQ
jgi:hypothetical protein